MEGVRLQKVLAQAGVASRRAAEAMISQGRVRVNGLTITELGRRVDPESDHIEVDGDRISVDQPRVYWLFYKPAGCVTTVRDPQGRRTVLDGTPEITERVFPVGRLDYDAEGLLVLTNDGDLAHQLQHPRYGVQKVYEVKVKGQPGPDVLRQLARGVRLEEGVTAPARVRLLRRLTDAAWLEIVLHQGWYRQIKRMCGTMGFPVLKIRRVAYGPLGLGGMKPGEVRRLTPREVRDLYEDAQRKNPQGRP
ncbi:MAG: rRNA pseudouridine synthase [Syntrophobacteraceae bacterium]|jgi:23S rRNA pseudouridine2605 synthase|nr:rRNA pseudouridine synthase [Syntrophobacteraceae bacterium]